MGFKSKSGVVIDIQPRDELKAFAQRVKKLQMEGRQRRTRRYRLLLPIAVAAGVATIVLMPDTDAGWFWNNLMPGVFVAGLVFLAAGWVRDRIWDYPDETFDLDKASHDLERANLDCVLFWDKFERLGKSNNARTVRNHLEELEALNEGPKWLCCDWVPSGEACPSCKAEEEIDRSLRDLRLDFRSSE